MFIGLGLKIGGLTTITPQTIGAEWENQSRIFWEDITTLWDSWSSVLGTFKFWEERTNDWNTYSSVNWEDLFE